MELLQYALDMDLEGEQYYREQAVKNTGNPLEKVLMLLADDEARHANILRDKIAGRAYTSEAEPEVKPTPNVFQDLEDYKASVKALPDQAELYLAAMEKEKQSVELYQRLRGQSTETEDRDLFDFLIMEENRHQTILEDFYHIVNRPKEWVESAEFGVREDY